MGSATGEVTWKGVKGKVVNVVGVCVNQTWLATGLGEECVQGIESIVKSNGWIFLYVFC